MVSKRRLVAVITFCVTIASACCGDPPESDVKSAFSKAAKEVFRLSAGKLLTFSCSFDEERNYNLRNDVKQGYSNDGHLGIMSVIPLLSKDFGWSTTIENYKKCGRIASTVAQGLGLCADTGLYRVFDACSLVKLFGWTKLDECKSEESVKKAIRKLAKTRFFTKDPKPANVEVYCYQKEFVQFQVTDSSGKVVKGLTVSDICSESTGSWKGPPTQSKQQEHFDAINRIVVARELCTTQPNLQSNEDFQKLFE